MARVPQAKDIAVSSFNVGNAAQIDIGVAKEIGRAGNAIGDAVAALGGAFGEIAGKAGAAQSAQAEADYILDWNQKDFNVWSGLSKNETPDGTSWQAAAPAYTETFNSHRSDPKYSSIPADRKVRLDRQIAGSIQQRIIGEGGAARRYQTGQYNTLVGDLKTRTETTIGELGPDSPLVHDLPPSQGDSAYNRLYEERRNALHAKIDASVGMTLSPKQAEEEKAKVDSALFQTKLQWLQKNDPDAYEKVLEEAGKLEREPVSEPQDGGATNETWRGPGSDGKPVGSQSNLGGPKLSEQQTARLQNVKPEIVDKLASLQQQFGRELPINSGFRDRGHNAKVGGAKGSQHIHGNAVDLDVRELSKDERVELIRQASAMGFTGIGVYNNAIHLDLGNRRSWGPSYGSDSVPKWAKAAIGDHLAGRMGALGKDDASRVQAAQGMPGVGAPEGVDPKAVESVVAVAGNIGVSPRAIGEVFNVESGWKTNQRTGSYMGISQVGPKTLAEMGVSKQEYLNMSQAEQAAFYGKWLEHYKFSEKMQEAGIDLSSLPPARQAAILQAFQFAPNGSWIKRLGQGDTNTPVTKSPQAKRLGSTSIADMEAFFSGRIGDEEAPPVSERGLVQVAGLKQAQEGVQVADASGAIPQSAIQEFMSRNGGKLQEVAQTEPDTPIAEIVSPEELEAIRSQLPEGIDVNAVTAGDAQELLSQAAPEVAQASGLHDGAQVAQAAPERPLGPVLGGYQFSVPSKYGNIKFRSEEWNNMKPETIKQLQKNFKVKRDAATSQTKSEAKDYMDDQSKALNDLKFEVTPMNPKVLDAAFPQGTKQRADYEKNVLMAQALGQVFADADGATLEEIRGVIDVNIPTEENLPKGQNKEFYRKMRELADKKYEKMFMERMDNPAQAVESHPLVKEARSQFQNNTPKSPDEKEALIQARMQAQKELGIPRALRSPITKGEARDLAMGLNKYPESRMEEGLTDLAKRIKDNYGKLYSSVVLQSVINATWDIEKSREDYMGRAVSAMSTANDPLGPLTMEEADEMFGRPLADQRDMYRGPNGYTRKAAEAAYDWSRLFGPVSMAKRISNSAGFALEKPTDEDIERVINGQYDQDEFMRRTGMSQEDFDTLLNKKLRIGK